MVKVVKLAHVGLNALDLSKQAEFYNDKWGLEPVDEFGREMFFRAEGPAHHVLTLHEQATPGLHHVALELAAPEDDDRAYEELAAVGIEVVTPPAQDLEPGIAKAIRFKDPDGFLVELVAGVDRVHDPFGPRDVKPQDLNHVVLNAGDIERSERFYREMLGFKLTDRFIDRLSFFACNAKHHSLAFGQAASGSASFNHAAFEMRDWEAWLKAVFYAGEGGIRRGWGPGRPLLGNHHVPHYHDPEAKPSGYSTDAE